MKNYRFLNMKGYIDPYPFIVVTQNSGETAQYKSIHKSAENELNLENHYTIVCATHVPFHRYIGC